MGNEATARNVATTAVTTERIDQVLVVHLDDGKANAISTDVIAAIHGAIDDAERDECLVKEVIHS